MNIIKKKAFWGIFLATLFSIFMVRTTHALTLIPPTLEFELVPGTTYETSVKVFNEEEKKIDLYSDVANFSAQGETGLPAFNFNEPIEGLSSWIEVEKGPVTINPGERITVSIKIKPPAYAEPGGHYSAIFFSEKPPEQGQVTIGSKLGVLLLARVAGAVVEQGNITEFSNDAKGMISRLPVNFIIRYQNTGNVHLRPTGTITIKNMLGKVATSLDVNPVKGATLPKSIRKYDAVWESSTATTATGNVWNKFWQEYRNERNNFAIGKYTAQVALTAGSQGGIQDTKTLAFWIMPWHIILIYALILIVVILLLIFLIKKYNSWLIKKALRIQQTVEKQKIEKKAEKKPITPYNAFAKGSKSQGKQEDMKKK